MRGFQYSIDPLQGPPSKKVDATSEDGDVVEQRNLTSGKHKQLNRRSTTIL